MRQNYKPSHQQTGLPPHSALPIKGKKKIAPPPTRMQAPVNLKWNQSWILIWRTDAEAPVFWPPDAKDWHIGKDLMLGKIEGRMRSGWQRMRWSDGHYFEQAPGVGDGQESLACCNPWDHKEWDTTEWLNWTNWRLVKWFVLASCKMWLVLAFW